MYEPGRGVDHDLISLFYDVFQRRKKKMGGKEGKKIEGRGGGREKAEKFRGKKEGNE